MRKPVQCLDLRDVSWLSCIHTGMNIIPRNTVRAMHTDCTVLISVLLCRAGMSGYKFRIHSAYATSTVTASIAMITNTSQAKISLYGVRVPGDVGVIRIPGILECGNRRYTTLGHQYHLFPRIDYCLTWRQSLAACQPVLHYAALLQSSAAL